MKKRLFKKSVKKMSDSELNEHVAYCENKRKIQILYAEFDRRFPDLTLKSEGVDIKGGGVKSNELFRMWKF